MIPIPSGVQVWLATGHTDMRNYAECTIMLSPGRRTRSRRDRGMVLTRHNFRKKADDLRRFGYVRFRGIAAVRISEAPASIVITALRNLQDLRV
jgi:hypothetical protein